MKRRFVILISCVVCFLYLNAAAFGMSAPWGKDSSLVDPDISNRVSAFSGASYSSALCFGWLYFYQKGLSVVVRSKCPLEPSCSNYSIEAVGKHGALVGVVLTCDRLFHEADEARRAQRVWVDGRWKALDLVAQNDFWWYGSREQR